MAIIKCKMCGGDLNIQEGMTVAECEYCGSKQTVPSADNEKKLTLFARANRLRAACEFDKAAGVYESIVADFPEEAEAYWGLLLCRYGIEYVDDPATGKKVPTCHRSSFESIMEDADFEQACENADAIARRMYRDEAKQLEEIRKGIIEVSGKEEPYDIFICYKETDESGDRTVDSVIAQDVYDALTDKGYRVFFSRISLEDKLGTEYEPYIFAALNSAKIMLAFGTDYEYYNAVWVKNEWSRFLKLMAADKSKYLIPCFKGIDAYDMPKEFAKLQAQDMSKVGAMQDLLRGIEKILPKAKPETVTVQQTVVKSVSGGPNTDSLLKRGFMALEDSEWDKADGFFEEVLNMDAECAEAYLGKLMVELKVSKRESLKDLEEPFDNSDNYQKIISFGDTALVEKIKTANEGVLIRNHKEQTQKMNVLAPLRERIRPAANQIIIAASHTVGLVADGTVLAIGRDDYDQCKVLDWRSIVAIAARGVLTVGLKSDGTVVVAGGDKFGTYQRDVAAWQNIVAIACSSEHPVGLRRDGTVVTAGKYNLYSDTGAADDFPVKEWRGVKAIACGGWYTVALQEDGIVNMIDDEGFSVFFETNWKDVISVACGQRHTVGLKADGTVVAVGFRDHEISSKDNEPNKYGQCDVSDWRDMVAVAAGFSHTVGLRSDGTVVAIGDNKYGQCEVNGWQDIIAIAACDWHTVGLRADGAVVATGDNKYGQCDTQLWYNVVTITTSKFNTAGITADGQVNVTGNSLVTNWANKYHQYATFGWKLFDNIDTLEEERDAAMKAAEERRIAEEKARQEQFAKLSAEKSALNTELSNLKGVFTGKRRKEIEARLEEIDAELKKLN